VFQFTELRARGQVRPMPPIAYDTLSTTESLTLNKSTHIVTIVSSLAGTIDFSTIANVDPDGTKSPFPINAAEAYDFGVRPGTKILFT
jgi:hypothetical protein